MRVRKKNRVVNNYIINMLVIFLLLFKIFFSQSIDRVCLRFFLFEFFTAAKNSTRSYYLLFSNKYLYFLLSFYFFLIILDLYLVILLFLFCCCFLFSLCDLFFNFFICASTLLIELQTKNFKLFPK